MQVLENSRKVHAQLDEQVQELCDTYNSFPFKDLKTYHENIKKSEEMERHLILKKVDEKVDKINNVYNSLDIGKNFQFLFTFDAKAQFSKHGDWLYRNKSTFGSVLFNLLKSKVLQLLKKKKSTDLQVL